MGNALNWVVIDSLDGLGKGTQIDLLKQKYQYVEFVHEPGSTKAGKMLREIALGVGFNSHRAETLTMLADRAEHVEMVVRPALNENKVIISDRSLVSGIGYGHGPIEQLLEYNKYATDELLPGAVILFHGDEDLIKERIGNMEETDAIEKRIIVEGLGIQRRMEEATKLITDKYIIINADQSVDEIHSTVVNFLQELWTNE